MNTGALVMMVVTEGLITILTVYFFYKVLTIKKHEEPDSFTENDDQE